MNQRAFLKPLSLDDYKRAEEQLANGVSALNCTSSITNTTASDDEPLCLLCDNLANPISKQQEFLSHLITAHKLVISDFNLIGDTKK